MLVYIYYYLMLVSFVTGCFYLKHRYVQLLVALLSASILTEIAVEIKGKEANHHYVFYHFFVIVEYVFITFILREWISNKRMRTTMLASAFVFCIMAMLISFNVQDFHFYPSINVNIEGLLILTWCIISFFSITPLENTPIYYLPVFWITLAFFLYFAGTLGINGAYNLLVEKVSGAKKISTLFNSISNYLLYILITIGILCQKWDLKYSAQ
jgi:hypothetical protein